MSDDLLQDPTNRIVAVFDDRGQAAAARQELLKVEELTDEDVRVLQGKGDAEDVDTAAKWFADTDDEIKRYERELRAGSIVITVPVTDSAGREKLHAILKQHDARLITHFGQWITEAMK